MSRHNPPSGTGRSTRRDPYDLSYRNATISSREPAIIEDFSGRKLYYVFGVERDGVAVGEIIVGANKGLFSHPWGLETPVGEYDIANAVQKARDTAARDFPALSRSQPGPFIPLPITAAIMLLS